MADERFYPNSIIPHWSLPKRLGLMAEAMVSAKVGPQARFFSRERVDEIVLLLREAEKHAIEQKARLRVLEAENSDQAREIVLQLRQRNQDISPGVWVCHTCGFQVVKAFLRASDGAVGIDAREVYDICPNDGTSLRPQTWKEAADEAVKNCLVHMDRASNAEAQRDTLRSALVGLLGVSTREELEQMEVVMRMMPAPAQDKAASVDAIHALLATLPLEVA